MSLGKIVKGVVALGAIWGAGELYNSIAGDGINNVTDNIKILKATAPQSAAEAVTWVSKAGVGLAKYGSRAFAHALYLYGSVKLGVGLGDVVRESIDGN